MKYLTLIRHAQAESQQTGQKDWDRGLDRIGERNASKMGVKLKELNLKPNRIFISDSIRTQQTCNLLVEQLDFPLGEVEQSELLYETSVGGLLNFVTALDDSYHDVTIISHNPSITYLVEYLTGEAMSNVPPTGVIRMKFEVYEWAMLTKGLGDLIYFVSPKMFDLE